MNNQNMTEEQKKTNRFNITAATIGLLGVLLTSGVSIHKSTDHLTSKCPFAFIYGDNIEEHHISEVEEEHPELVNIKKKYEAPAGYVLDGVKCYTYKDDGTILYAFPKVSYIKEINNISEEEFKEQVRRLYLK